MSKLLVLLMVVAIQISSACIPLGLGAGCNCQQNPSCGQCFQAPSPPISPTQCAECSAFSNDVQPSFFNTAPYTSPDKTQQVPTANNQYPQALSQPQEFSHQPVAIPIASPAEYQQQPPSPVGSLSNNNINERDQELRNAISEFNEKEHANFPFPGETTQRPTKTPKVVLPPAAEPPSDEYSGLPSIYFTMRPNTQIPTTKETIITTESPSTNDPYSDDLSPPQKANVSIQSTEETTTNGLTSTLSYRPDTTRTETTHTYTTTTIKPSSTKAYAFASGTYWAVLEERETENGATQQRRIPYHAYEQEVCTGATLGRSIEKDLKDVAVKCTMIGCAAVNVRPISEDSDQFEAIYLKNVNARRQIKASKVYTCISIVDVPKFEHVYEQREKEIQKQLEDDETDRRRVSSSKVINQPPRLRFANQFKSIIS